MRTLVRYGSHAMGHRNPEDWERLRRSVAMLSPGHPCQLSRETAMELLEELVQRSGRDRRLRRLVAELETVLREGPQ